MKRYTIYTAEAAPEELLAKYPHHAIYAEGEFFLFAESLEQVTGVALLEEDVDDYTNTEADEDFMSDAVEEDMSILNKEERIAARVAARVQARKDARIAFRVARRKAIRVADRRELRFSRRQGRKLYDDWLELQETSE